MTSKLIGNIKDFTSKWHYLKQEVDDKLSGLKQEVDDKLSGLKQEVDDKLSGKSDVGHTHSDNDVSVTTTNYGSGLNQNSFNRYLSNDMRQVKNKVDSVVHTSIALDKYNCKVGDTVTVTVTVTGGDGVGLSDYKVDLYCNGTSLSKGYTNTEGVYTYDYIISSEGVLCFSVGAVSVNCMVNEYFKVITSNFNYQLLSDEHTVILKCMPTTRTYPKNAFTKIDTIPSKYSKYLPPTDMFNGSSFKDFSIAVLTNGEIRVYNWRPEDLKTQVTTTFYWRLGRDWYNE